MTHSGDKPLEPGGGSQLPTSASLLRAAREDEQTAWRQLVGLYSPPVYTWLRRRGVSPEDAADICQDVMRSVARSLNEFVPDGKPASFRRWLHRITQRRLADFCRRQERHVGRPTGGADSWFEKQEESGGGAWGAEAESTANHVPEPYRRALEQVRAEYAERNWLIFWRVVVDECETADVAKEFSVSNNVVRLAKSRISRRLREVFEEMKEVSR
jgi:RNA polymerase sigma-70 factor (ECF subfamily)